MADCTLFRGGEWIAVKALGMSIINGHLHARREWLLLHGRRLDGDTLGHLALLAGLAMIGIWLTRLSFVRNVRP